jgi:hypothetical protein
MTSRKLVVTYPLDDEGREIVTVALEGAGDVIGLEDRAPEARAGILANVEVLLARNLSKEPGDSELELLTNASLLRFVSPLECLF